MTEPTFRDFPVKLLIEELEDCERLIERSESPNPAAWAITKPTMDFFLEIAEESRADILKIAIIAKEFYDASQKLIKKYNLEAFNEKDN